jgi:hypothetical protein
LRRLQCKYFIAFINSTSLLIAYNIALSLWNLDTLAKDEQEAQPEVS